MIAVVGSQSAGKSSLIESISGITLPRAAGTCTRQVCLILSRVLVLILSTGVPPNVVCRIQPKIGRAKFR